MAEETCTVLCNLPHGYQLELTGRDGKTRTVRLKGQNSHIGRVVAAPAHLVYPPGRTDNVNKAFMDEWLKRHADLTPVKNGLIVVLKNDKDAEIVSHTLEENPTGLNPIDPDSTVESRIPKAVETFDEET